MLDFDSFVSVENAQNDGGVLFSGFRARGETQWFPANKQNNILTQKSSRVSPLLLFVCNEKKNELRAFLNDFFMQNNWIEPICDVAYQKNDTKHCYQ